MRVIVDAGMKPVCAYALVAAVAVAAEARADLARGHAAFRAGEYQDAAKLLAPEAAPGKPNRDYALHMQAESAFYAGEPARARALFGELAKLRGSRFAPAATWRIADCLWAEGRRADAVAAYRRVVKGAGGDAAVGRFRIAEAAAGDEARRLYTQVHVDFPLHPLGVEAGRRAGTPQSTAPSAAPAADLSPRERLKRAATMTAAKDFLEAHAELERIPASAPADLLAERDYELGMVKYKTRHDYAAASALLLGVATRLQGEKAAAAAFHGARALSRIDRDDEALAAYLNVVQRYPTSRWAAEAQYRAGWVQFNRGRYREAVPHLEKMLARFGRTPWADDAAWYLAFSHWLLGEADRALPALEQHARLTAGSGEDAERVAYWRARILGKTGRAAEEKTALRELVQRAPLTYYGTLARAQLRAAGEKVEITLPRRDPAFPRPGRKLLADAAVVRAEALLQVGLVPEAGYELRRAEETLEKKHGRAEVLPLLLERYPRMEAYRRGYELAEARAAAALTVAPEGPARVAWEAALPRAWREHVEKYGPSAGNPDHFLYTIMMKETRFAPHEVSPDDARGVLQLLPELGEKLARELGLPFHADQLFDPETNIRLAAAHLGKLFKTFRGQPFLVAAAYNGGIKPTARWLDQYGKRPLDEFVELIAYEESRLYAKRVVGIYARYRYLYAEPYDLPLTVDARYQIDAQ